MSKHWRIELVGGPLDGTVHESLCAAVPDRMGLLFDGERYWYEIKGKTAKFIGGPSMSPPKRTS